MRRKIFGIGLLVVVIGVVGCIYSNYFYVYHGRVIDADSKLPIEGAVVVASWREDRPTIAGPTSRVKDVKEALTDRNGEWSLRGPRGEKLGPSTLLSYITSFFTGFMWGTYYTQRPEFIVFKPGYCSWPKGFGIKACAEKIKPGGNQRVAEGEAVELPGLTKNEDRRAAQRISLSILENDKGMLYKIRDFRRLMNEERRYLGLEEVDF